MNIPVLEPCEVLFYPTQKEYCDESYANIRAARPSRRRAAGGCSRAGIPEAAASRTSTISIW